MTASFITGDIDETNTRGSRPYTISFGSATGSFADYCGNRVFPNLSCSKWKSPISTGYQMNNFAHISFFGQLNPRESI